MTSILSCLSNFRRRSRRSRSERERERKEKKPFDRREEISTEKKTRWRKKNERGTGKEENHKVREIIRKGEGGEFRKKKRGRRESSKKVTEGGGVRIGKKEIG